MTEAREMAIETARKLHKMFDEGVNSRGLKPTNEVESLYVNEMMKDIESLKQRVANDFFPNYGFGVSDLIHLVCEHYLTTPEKIMSKSRKREFVEPRQMIHWMLKNKVVENCLTYESIAELTGGYHYTVIIHSNRAINHRIQTEPKFRNELIRLCESLGCTAIWKGKSIHIIRNEQHETIPS